MGLPIPGAPVRGSRTGKPIMALLDLLGRRWLARIIWELKDGPQTFRALRIRCDDMSPSVLNQRLGELREVLLVEVVPNGGYDLTVSGKTLLTAMAPLMQWAAAWDVALQDSIRPADSADLP